MEERYVLFGETYKNNKYVTSSIGACSNEEKELVDLVHLIAKSHDTEVYHTDKGICYEYDEFLFVCNIEKVPYYEEEGIWEYSPKENIAICSKCGYEYYLGTYREYATNYCPNCGVKMKSVH